MNNIIGFPHGFRGSDNGDVEPPCECSDGHGVPTSSNPFPWFRVHTTANRCYASVQLSHTERMEVEITESAALDMIAELAIHVRRQVKHKN